MCPINRKSLVLNVLAKPQLVLGIIEICASLAVGVWTSLSNRSLDTWPKCEYQKRLMEISRRMVYLARLDCGHAQHHPTRLD